MAANDKEILALLQQNKQEGLSLLFDCYYRPLVLLADMYTHNSSTAEDIVQEQFVKFWDKKLYHQIKSYSALKNYLFTMVKNASINSCRRKDILWESTDIFEAEIGENTTKSITEEGIVAIKKAIADLPEQTRKVVDHIMLQDMKYQETADELGISINTVKTHLKRGMLKLKEELKDKVDLLYLFLLTR